MFLDGRKRSNLRRPSNLPRVAILRCSARAIAPRLRRVTRLVHRNQGKLTKVVAAVAGNMPRAARPKCSAIRPPCRRKKVRQERADGWYSRNADARGTGATATAGDPT